MKNSLYKRKYQKLRNDLSQSEKTGVSVYNLFVGK